jgi:fructokinase
MPQVLEVSDRAPGQRPGVVAVAGEALMDMVPAGDGLFEAAPGGSPANVAVALARLDVPARLLARLSDDVLGRRLRRHLAANDVDLSHAVQAGEPSSLAVVALDEQGVAEYDFRVDGTADWQWSDEELADALDGPVVALHSGSLALTRAPGASALARLLARARERATVSYDPNCRPLLMGSSDEELERVERLVALADVVKVSSEDIAWLSPGSSPARVAADWLARGPSLVVVTLGPDGALACARAAGEVVRPGQPVEVVDTVGAGDAFTGALLAGLHRRDLLGAEQRPALAALDAATIADVLDEAVLASAMTCTRRGADPPRRAALLDATPLSAP